MGSSQTEDASLIGCAGGIAVFTAFIVIMTLTECGLSPRVQYPKGFCHALNADVVSDSFCVRNDTIISRVRWGKF